MSSIKVLKVPPSSEFWYQKSLLVSFTVSQSEVGGKTNGQDSELQAVYAFAPPAPYDHILDKARTAYLKATGAIADESKEAKESRQDDSSHGKRKDAVGEDCPV